MKKFIEFNESYKSKRDKHFGLVHLETILENMDYIMEGIDSYPYEINETDPNHIRAKFDADGLPYNVSVWHDERKHAFGEFELSFDVTNQKHAGERQGRDIRHLNNVLYTVMDITEEIVKKHNIKKIKIDGASDEKDATGLFADTLRGRVYTRFLNNRYPSEAIDAIGRFIKIDMTKAFPDIIKDDKGNADKLIDLLIKMSDEYPDEAGIKRGLDGPSDDDFTISTDFIESSKFGNIYIIINVNRGWDEYSVEWNLFDSGEEGSEDFSSYEDLYNFIEGKFL